MVKKKRSWKTTLLGVLVAVGSIAIPFIQDARTRENVAILIGIASGGGLVVAKDGDVGTKLTDDQE